MNILSRVKPSVQSLKAYEAKDIPCQIKLDANESPYNFNEIISTAGTVPLNRYPDPEAKALKNIVAHQVNLSRDNILLGNGSDELISYLIMTFGGPVLYPAPTFSMYGIIAQSLGEKRVGIDLDEHFDIDLTKMTEALTKEKPSLIFLSIPNNPTGNSFSYERVLSILETTSAIVVIDEAYRPFSGQDLYLSLMRKYDNLVLFRTLSKIGFASLRVGYMLAAPELINEVNKVRLPFNVNSFSQALAVEALNKKEEIDKTVQTIIKEREFIFHSFSQLPGIIPYPSSANFILFKAEKSEFIFQALLRKGILIRNLHPAIHNCLRVTVGNPTENKIFVNTLKEIIDNETGTD